MAVPIFYGKTAKTEKSDSRQRSITRDISTGKGSLGKVGNNVFSLCNLSRCWIRLLSLQLCQNYMPLCVRIGKIDRL